MKCPKCGGKTRARTFQRTWDKKGLPDGVKPVKLYDCPSCNGTEKYHQWVVVRGIVYGYRRKWQQYESQYAIMY